MLQKLMSIYQKKVKIFSMNIKLMLTDNNILFKEDEKLVRGLDYYTQQHLNSKLMRKKDKMQF
jgi:histidyl-tRNA synthetase